MRCFFCTVQCFVIDDAVLLSPLHCRTFPIRGFQIYDGPVQLTQSTFRGFIPTPERYTSAVGFNLKNTWQLTPRNNLSQLSFCSTVSSKPLFIWCRTIIQKFSNSFLNLFCIDCFSRAPSICRVVVVVVRDKAVNSTHYFFKISFLKQMTKKGQFWHLYNYWALINCLSCSL